MCKDRNWMYAFFFFFSKCVFVLLSLGGFLYILKLITFSDILFTDVQHPVNETVTKSQARSSDGARQVRATGSRLRGSGGDAAARGESG